MTVSQLTRQEYDRLEKVLREFARHEAAPDLKVYKNRSRTFFQRDGAELSTAAAIAKYINFQ